MIISKTPFRISFCGGGTDFEDYFGIYGGQVVSTTIDKYIYVTVNHKFDNKIHLRYSKTECVDNVEDLEHNIVREALLLVGVKKGIEITIISDIPTQGTGLGSSSSLTVGVLKALYAYNKQTVLSPQIAFAACQIEIEKLKSPIGKQDQYAVAYGGFNRFMFHKVNGVQAHKVENVANKERLKWLEESTMLFYLNGRVANDILGTHKNGIQNKLSVLNEQKLLVSYFINWVDGDGSVQALGDLINTSWELKKKMTPQATSERIESIISSAINAGAVGAKLCGAGGGGFLMVVCDESKRSNVREKLKDLLELNFKFEKEGSKIIYGY